MTIDHVLAGYLVAARATRLDWRDAGLSGPELVSMSECVVDLVSADDLDDWFADAASAEQARLLAGRSDLHVLAVGVAAGDVAPLVQDITDGVNGLGAGGLAAQLDRRQPLAAGRVLGFEPVGFDLGSWHTWTCLGGLVDDVREATGVRPGPGGLIADEASARRAAGWLTASNLGDPKVFRWTPVLLVEVEGP